MKRVVIIGGGAAGLMAACAAASQKDGGECSITVVEKNPRPARKLMITGKGRCNLTNNCDVNTLIQNVTKNGKFLYSAFNNFNSQDTMAFFESAGVPLKTERGNRVFPVSDKSVDIVDALVKKALKCCEIVQGTAVGVLAAEGRVTAVKLADGRKIEANSVIVATGGVSYPLTGSTGDGYRIASELGHNVTELSPSLIGLECHEGFVSRLAGLSLKNVTLSLYEEQKKKPVFTELGELLFTHSGISGPLTLSASAHIKDIKQPHRAVIDLKPALDENALDKRILRDFEENLNRDFSNSLDKLLPKSLIPVIISMSGIKGDTKVNQISREERLNLVRAIKEFTLSVVDFRPIEEAVVTRGGISVREINPSTMGSRLIEGLYFAGEVIDVDAYTGGFNLQIAFSTGFLAGQSAAKI